RNVILPCMRRVRAGGVVRRRVRTARPARGTRKLRGATMATSESCWLPPRHDGAADDDVRPYYADDEAGAEEGGEDEGDLYVDGVGWLRVAAGTTAAELLASGRLPAPLRVRVHGRAAAALCDDDCRPLAWQRRLLAALDAPAGALA